MAYAKDSGSIWHLEAGLTTKEQVRELVTAATSKDMIKAAGLGWKVGMMPLKGGPKNMQIPGRNSHCIFREDTGAPLGVGSSTFCPVQNDEAFDFMDSLHADGVAKYVTAGSLFGGARIWILMELTKDMKVGKDKFKNFILASNGHDTLAKFRAGYCGTRVVCNNTLQCAHGELGGGSVALVHNSSVLTNLQKAQKVLAVTTAEAQRLQQWLAASADVKVTPEVVVAVSDAMFGSLDDDTPTQRKNAIEKFKSIYGQEVALNGDTAYSVINAVTGYADHAKRYTGDSSQRAQKRFQAVMAPDGSAAKMKSAGIAALEIAVPELVTIK